MAVVSIEHGAALLAHAARQLEHPRLGNLGCRFALLTAGNEQGSELPHLLLSTPLYGDPAAPDEQLSQEAAATRRPDYSVEIEHGTLTYREWLEPEPFVSRYTYSRLTPDQLANRYNARRSQAIEALQALGAGILAGHAEHPITAAWATKLDYDASLYATIQRPKNTLPRHLRLLLTLQGVLDAYGYQYIASPYPARVRGLPYVVKYGTEDPALTPEP